MQIRQEVLHKLRQGVHKSELHKIKLICAYFNGESHLENPFMCLLSQCFGEYCKTLSHVYFKYDFYMHINQDVCVDMRMYAQARMHMHVCSGHAHVCSG